ncbi:hypothetical protein SeMB42_g01079 [Synchytrium endobioticum]|uniref:Major facilitator superfamily (MFS) profile domain-containing protein n=1 Tax=Synchytrium endobioticum TaxID=286115 RepID=A0A507DP42_9FUNG|nr:hypothetical protein SeMB42_g01079 [Synchytrium endobioticum]
MGLIPLTLFPNMAFGFYAALTAIGSSLGGFLFGYEIGIIDQILVMSSFQDYFGTARDLSGYNGNITSLFLVGCVVGALLVSFGGDLLGRKKIIFIGGLFFILGGALQTGSNSIGMLYAGRMIGGCGVGILSTIVPMFIAESAPANIRGTVVSIFQLAITLGILVASAVNTGIIKGLDGTETEWRLSFGLQILPGLFLISTIMLLPESPRYLAMKNQWEETLDVLAKIYNRPRDSAPVQDEFREIRLSVERDRAIGTASWSELLLPNIRKRVLMVIILQLFQQWTGINVIMYYAASLFTDMGFHNAASSTTFVIVNAAINFVATFPALYLVETAGRRQLLIWGGVGITVSHILVTSCLKASENNPSAAWGGIIFVYTFVLSFATTWGPIVWVIQSEVLPLRVRSKGVGLGTVSNWVWNAVIAKVAPIIGANWGIYQYLVYAIFGIAMTSYAYFWVPETKGVELEEMDQVFGSPGAVKGTKTFKPTAASVVTSDYSVALNPVGNQASVSDTTERTMVGSTTTDLKDSGGISNFDGLSTVFEPESKLNQDTFEYTSVPTYDSPSGDVAEAKPEGSRIPV